MSEVILVTCVVMTMSIGIVAFAIDLHIFGVTQPLAKRDQIVLVGEMERVQR